MMAQERTDQISGVVQRGRWGEEEGRVVVDAWRRSGKSLRRFATEHGITPWRISRWAGRLKAWPGGRTRFYPVRLLPTNGREPSEALEVVLVDGRRVRVPAGFAAEDLARLLAVLKREGAC
jgi:hypothetical protein